MNSALRDRLAQALGAGANRRQVLGGLAGSAAASLISSRTSVAKAHDHHKRHRHSNAILKVISLNLYLGSDLSPLFAVTTLEELIAAGTAMFAIVKETDFPARAKVLAEEIADFEPHLVGLQEVSLWRTQTPSDGNATPNAEDVAYDFLATLLKELAKRGAKYRAVSTIKNFDGKIPIEGGTGLLDLRLTDRDVILARTDLPRAELAVSNPQSAHFATNLSFPNPVLGEVTVLRGWTAVDVARKGVRARVVNTHLEAIAPAVQIAQGEDLLAGPLDTTLPTVLTGDLNSDAYGVGTPGQTDTPTYQNMLDAGFVDAWPSHRGQEESYTCCQAEDLLNEESSLSERIDFVLTRGAITALSAARLGADPRDKTPSGLWPSDHAGVAATLRLRRA